MKYHLPTRLRFLREAKGMTIVEVASKLHLVPKVISGWEVGESEPDVTQRMMLARIMGAATLG